ncbi:E3 ubiquitin protein ligase DRIP2 [Apostasia shenzhenica]|uniref:E3 ubiquitin protein ligase DRIP2 n=1 Tax=Apostasia shenzhenica TaxID=1088818 RepID=A0A2H9ZUG4_9ASPA|nr:E3 ubiquitin protein ligase DRIP2 [Apostasia shenzhenica]
MASGPTQVMRVKRELLASCMMCPLCHKLLRDATTISECLHTFCRKCILEKITDEDVDCCPICNIDLGCVPEEKLRPDHSLEDVRAKIFPYKRKKVNAPEVLPSITLPPRRKERSLSSLVVNTPQIGTQSGFTGRRTKSVARRSSTVRGPMPAVDELNKKVVDNSEDDSNAPVTSSKMANSRRQNMSNAETSERVPVKVCGNGQGSFVNKSELWKPLNCLVEAANRTKGLKSCLQAPVIKSEQTNDPNSENNMFKTKIEDHVSKVEVQDHENNNVSTYPMMPKAKRMHTASRKRKELGLSAQAVLDAANATHERRISPVWLSLVSSSERKGDAHLLQKSVSYLRIKEGNLPVSFLQKYLLKKLNLRSENEVEIACDGRPVNPSLSLHDLTEEWLQSGPSQRVQASVGSSAKDFVMVLTYSLKSL